MIDVIEVTLNKDNNLKFCSPDNYDLYIGQHIIVNTERGLQFATVAKTKFKIKAKNLKEALLNIVRVCSKDDINQNLKNIKDSKKAYKKCQELIRKYKMDMNLIDAYYTFDRKQLIFQFIADGRVDFRKLAKDLANFYKTRIELHQIGVRDKAKMMGGCGQCGRELCCQRLLNNFESVSINMAKNQNLSLNPSKINGVCGRLLCCLNYEDEIYKKARKKMPTIGKQVETEKGKGKVISLDVLKQRYRVDVSDYGIVECDINESN